jgi:glycerol 3-phosphatase-2
VLGSSSEALDRVHDLVMLDLDGVVYVGGKAVPGAREALTVARDAGAQVAFITNNAARTPQTVADHLTELGIDAVAADVVTSAQAAARVLLDRHGAGSDVWVLGGPGLVEAVRELGLVPVGPRDGPVALVTGYGPQVRWAELMEAAVRIAEGLPWVASNTDHSLPTRAGRAPGHGVLVRMLSDFAGVEPVVAGKPARPLLDETVRRVGGVRPLMVGDRLDTDIEGAVRVGIDSLLVLTGVTGLTELVSAPPGSRPTYLATDLAGLGQAHPTPRHVRSGWLLGDWHARVTEGRLEVERRVPTGEPAGAAAGTRDDWFRVAACAAWEHLDEHGAVAEVSGLRPPPLAGAAAAGPPDHRCGDG